MAFIGMNQDQPDLAKRIHAYTIKLHRHVASTSKDPDVTVNAVARLAVSLLVASDVTKEQAEKLFSRLINAEGVEWKRDN